MSEQYPGGFINKTAPTLNPALGNAAPGVWNMTQVQQAIKAGTWPSYDPYSKYTTLLLHGDGTNGGQNNTFLDSSSNNFTITRNGNTTQGSFSPYGSNWSNYFDGSSNVTFPNNTALQLSTATPFCLETWIFPTALANADNGLIAKRAASVEWQFAVKGSAAGANDRQIYLYNNSSTFLSGTQIPGTNTWTHVACTWDGTTLRFFINGTLCSSTYTSFSLPSPGTNTLSVGANGSTEYFTGYLSNARIVKGSAVYTSSFTPSTTPLTAITNTSLLTCQSNRFIDTSSNAFSATISGSPSVQRFSPFAPSAAYSTATIGGSGYFDGTGDYLSVAASANQDFGSSSFTVEFWWYPNADSRQWFYHASTDYWFGIDYKSSGSYMGLWASSNGTSWNLINADPGGNGISTGTPKINAWNHVAIGRSSGTWSLWLNGTRVLNLTGITSAIVSRSAQAKIIGGWAAGSQYIVNGYMNDFRVVIGTDVYGVSNSTITVPTAPLTAVTNTQLLTNFTNGSIFDNAMMIDLETVGNAQISTSVKKYGTGSLYFDGSGDYLKTNTSPVFNLSTGNWTIEGWFYPLSHAGNMVPIIVGATGADKIVVATIAPNGYLYYLLNGSGVISSTSVVTLNTWSHFALVKNGSTTTLYLNGTSIGTTTSVPTSSSKLAGLGADMISGGANVNGYIDDLRITNGVARYTANFTPPTSQLQDQ